MKRNVASLVLANLAVLYAVPAMAGGSMEYGIGSTFDRNNSLNDGAAVSAAYVTDGYYPTEIAGGWIQDDGSANSNDNFYVSVGKRVQARNGLFAGAGVALTSETDTRIKEHLNAKLQVGYARGPMFVKVEHLTSGSGRGESMAFVGYRHSF